MADNLSKVNVTTNETVDGEVKEKSPPVFSFGGTYLTTGVQTTPNLARGVLTNTGVSFSNANLSHACDINFILSGFNINATGLFPNFGMITAAIQNGKNAAASVVRGAMSKLIAGIRLAINAIIISLNLDPSGALATAFSRYKKIIREINEKIKQIAQVVADAAFYYYLAQEIIQIVKWIQSLPAQLAAMFKDCLTKFGNSIKSIPTQLTSSLHQAQAAISSGMQASLTAAQGVAGGVTVDPALINAINDPLNSGIDSINSAIAGAQAAGAVAAAGSFSNQKSNSSKP
jgi:hypothetical protein